MVNFLVENFGLIFGTKKLKKIFIVRNLILYKKMSINFSVSVIKIDIF